MTADLTAAADKLADNSRPRDELLAELTGDTNPRGWLVVHQFPNLDTEQVVCSHLTERGATWCAERKERNHHSDLGRIHYTVRRAES
jgi:hypothetical protein